MKISVIMAVYNAEETIEQAIQSVISQDYNEKELIIIDGKSRDSTTEIIKKYEKDIAYWCSEADCGIYDAMNKGIMKSTGDVIAFLNSDDWYENHIFERVRFYFSSDEIDILAGQVNHVVNNKIFSEDAGICNPEDIRYKMIYSHQGMFARREVFEKIGRFNLRYRLSADYEWMLRAFSKGCRFKSVNDVFANYRSDGRSFVQIYQGVKEHKEIARAYAFGSESLLNKINDFFEKMDDMLDVSLYRYVWKHDGIFVKKLCKANVAYYIWGTGCLGKECCKLFWNVGIEIAGFIDTYRKKDYLYGYPVLSPEQLKGDEWICIASDQYESEIIGQISDMGCLKHECLLFSKMKKKMIQHGREHYLDQIMGYGEEE